MFPNLLKIMKITYLLFFLCKHTPADQYMASMDACCNFSSLLSAVLLCPNSSSLLFSSPPNGLSLHAWSVQVVLVHLYSSVLFLTLLYLFLLLPFCFDITNFLGFNEKVKDIIDKENTLQINQLIIVLWISSNRLKKYFMYFSDKWLTLFCLVCKKN